MEDKKNLQGNYDALNNTLQEMQGEIEQIKSKNKSLEEAYDEAVKKLKGIERTEDVQKELAEVSKKKQEYENTISSLKKDLESKQKFECPQCRTNKKEVKDLKEELQQTKNDAVKLRSDINTYKKDLKLKGEEIKIFTTERDQYKKEAEQLQGFERQMRDEFGRTMRSQKDNEHTIDNLNTRLVSATSQLQEHGAEIAILDAERKDTKSEANALARENAELRKQLTQV